MEKVTAGQIKQWKAQHKEVFLLTVTVDDEGNTAEAYVKKPSMDVLGAAAKFQKNDPLKSGVILFEGCWLGGDQVIKENDEAKMAAIGQIQKLFKARTATLKKL